MDRIVLLNKRGVTIIEMMISLMFLLVVSLALMQTALIGISTNVQNALRAEAVNVAEMRINQLTSLVFSETFEDDWLKTPGSTPAEPVVERKFRGFSVNYAPTRTITNISSTHKQIAITVSWDYKGKTYTHGVTTIMRRQ